MEIRDVALKYKINAYRMSKEYPSKEDILFDIIEYIMSKRKRKKNWTPNEFVMSLSEINEAIPLFSTEDGKKLIKQLLYNLFEESYITYEGSNLGVSKKAIEIFYKI